MAGKLNGRARTHKRRVFFADFDGAVLVPSRGAFVVETDAVGERTSEYRVTGPLVANVGDRLVIAANDHTVDEVANVTVVAIERDGTAMRVHVTHGVVNPGRVSVMRSRRAA